MKENLVRNAPAAVVDSFDLLSDPDTFLLPFKDWLTAMFMSNTKVAWLPAIAYIVRSLIFLIIKRTLC